MEPEPDQDPEHDGPSDREPSPGTPRPDDAGTPGGPASGSPGSPGSPDAAGGEDDGSDFGSWEDLEGTLAAAREREELLSGFAPGGVWDKHPPGPELAAALARAAGRDWRCGSATGEELVGLLRAMAALQSWSGAGLLGIIRALIRDDDLDFLGRARHGDLPDVWDDSLVHEIALALAVSAPSAEKTTRAAWALGARLPGVELLLKDGTLDLPRARLVAEVFEDLSDGNCAKAEELLLPELTAPPRKTYTQVERLATAIAVGVDPDLAERRRKKAEQHRSRVMMFREPSGTAALSGRDLPTEQTLAAYANLDARARQYQDCGEFPGERIDRLRATAFLDLLNGISADARIACGTLSPDDPCPDDTGPDDAGPDDTRTDDRRPGTGPDDTEPGPDDLGPDVPPGGDAPGPRPYGGGEPGPRPGPGGEPGLGGSDCPCSECDGRCAPPDDGGLPDDDPDDGPAAGHPRCGDPNPGPGPNTGPGRDGAGRGGGAGGGGAGDGGQPTGGPDASQPPGGDQPAAPPTPPRPPLPKPDGGPKPTLADLIVPLATLLGQAERPGEGHGLGTLDPALARTLAATATRSPHTTICITVTDHNGIAIGHGCATPGRHAQPPDGHAPPLIALPARINLTITATRLAQLRARPDTGPPGTPRAPQTPGPLGPPGQRRTGWALAPPDIPGTGSTRATPSTGSPARARGTPVARRPQRAPGDPDWCGPWTLTLPSGLQRTADLQPMPTFDCDHRHESRAYKPNDTLRHLVQIRDHTCTFPTCNRHARASDFEHAVPYDQGGRTCACNAGARSRKCHRVKQSPNWNLTQPQPGWHQWTTPRGRTYTQGPKQYPV
jgi:hypothetical protein